MAKETKIAWTDATFNAWRGCYEISPGCVNCYAREMDKRWGGKRWGKLAPRTIAAEAYWRQPLKWHDEARKSGRPFRVFCGSLMDVCEDREDLLVPRARLMRLIENTPALTWQLCTKRPENYLRLFGRRWSSGWPKNVWVLTTAENQEQADKRIPHLCRVPAAVRGISYEPALGPVIFQGWDGNVKRNWLGQPEGIQWVIVGGESGSHARPFEIAWARAVRDHCRAADVKFFYKQGGSSNRCEHDKKGEHVECFPSDLQVQEFPDVA